MGNAPQGRLLSTAARAMVLSLGILASACDSGDGPAADQATEATEATDSDAATASDSGGNTARITIGDDTWTVVPSIQCSVYPGGVVSIAGHAAGNEAIEIVLDHDPSSELVQVYVQGPDDSPYWVAGRDDVSFEIDGKTVTGNGTFSIGPGAQVEEGQPGQARGRFEITC